MIFQDNLFGQWFNTDEAWVYHLFYLFGPCICNFGWSFCQISHMAMLPQLTCSRRRKDKLSNLRMMFTYISQLSVFIVAFFFFWLIPEPLNQFRILGCSIVILGVGTCLYFIIALNEPKLSKAMKKKAELLKTLELQHNQNLLQAVKVETTTLDPADLDQKRQNRK